MKGKQPSFNDSGVFLSARERTAIKAERDMNDRLKITYMKDRTGDSFDAIISGKYLQITEGNGPFNLS